MGSVKCGEEPQFYLPEYSLSGGAAAKTRLNVNHVYAYGKVCPDAAGIIHLGATSCYVTDNADLILYREGLRYLRGELLAVLANLSEFAEKYKATPTLGYTHYQPAQPVTVGKRAALWMQDLLADLDELDFVLDHLRFLGCRGTTGTEASFLDLFEGDGEKVDEMNRRIAAEFGFVHCFSVCGQTYPRKLDSRILNALSSIAQSCYRFANDLRLLQHDRQLEEPFEKSQIGSSAMWQYYTLGKLTHYLADAFTYPHNENYPDSLLDHRRYEDGLREYLAVYLGARPAKPSVFPEGDVISALEELHRQYMAP